MIPRILFFVQLRQCLPDGFISLFDCGPVHTRNSTEAVPSSSLLIGYFENLTLIRIDILLRCVLAIVMKKLPGSGGQVS